MSMGARIGSLAPLLERASVNREQAALLVNVQRFQVGDGPGMRSTVVLKGCPLRCLWCDRPEARLLRPEVIATTMPCLGCVAGDVNCHQHEAALAAEADGYLPHRVRPQDLCPREALRLVGQSRTVDQVLAILDRDAPLYRRTGGGITVAGGEPLYQSEFTLEILRAARQRGWHTALDTSGHCSVAVFEEALELCDLVIFSLRETDLDLHQVFCGVPIEPIIRNLVRAAVSDAELWVRLPVVPKANDRDDHWHQVGNLVGDLPGPPSVHLLPYRGPRFGGEPQPGQAALTPSRRRVRQVAAILGAYGLDVHLH